MKRLLLPAAAVLWACSTTTPSSSSGNFVGPSGMAVAQAGDRDLLFITSTGTDELRALQMCNTPRLADGGVDPADTCPPAEDYQFVPSPMRLFPATVPTGDRPMRMAGTRLLRPDGGKGGVALVAGANDAITIIDARNLIEAMNHIAPARPPLSLPLDTPAIDVVAAETIDPATNVDISVPSVRAFVATHASAAVSAQLLVLDVRLDASGNAQLPTVVQRCGLDKVLPRRLALVPGRDDVVYVADGAGDGAIRVLVSKIPAAGQPLQSCGDDRIPAGGPTRSIALSPEWYESGQPDHPAGELAMMVRDDGGTVFTRTSDARIVPIPPFDYRDSGQQAMEPLLITGEARDATFLRSVRPSPSGCASTPCTLLFVGDSVSGSLQKFNLLAVMAGTEGGTWFVDVPGRRMVNANLFVNHGDALTPTFSATQVFSPAFVGDNPPTLDFAPADPNVAGHTNAGWFNAGVTRATRWRVVWHAAIPGLERRGGTITRTATGKLLFQTQPANLTAWTGNPLIKLAPGDVVSFTAYFAPATGCDELLSEPSGRFELTIHSIATDGSSMELDPLLDTPTTKGFDPTCPKFGVAGEVRTAGDHPWLVYEDFAIRGRARSGEMFVAMEPRFDYPRDYDATLPPKADTDIAVAFTLGGSNPPVIGSQWTFSMASGQLPVVVRDPNSPQGLASQVVQYSSLKVTNLLFTTLTGANAVIQSAPDLLAVRGGILAYR